MEGNSVFECPVLINGAPQLLKFRKASFEEVTLLGSRISVRLDESARISKKIEALEADREAGKDIDSLSFIKLKDSSTAIYVDLYREIRGFSKFILEPKDIAANFDDLMTKSEHQGTLMEACTKYLEHVSMAGDRGKNS
jgi:predicted phage-related endonuclease